MVSDPEAAMLVASFPVGDHSVSLVVTDEEGISSSEDSVPVIIRDTTPPTVALNGESSLTLECGVDSYEEVGAEATDICDPNVPVEIGGDVVDVSQPGDYQVSYSATDASGNTGSTTRDVEVQDTIPPVLTLTLSPDSLWPPNHKMTEITPTITVTDECDPNPTIELVSIVSDEPDEGLGDGDTVGDIDVAADGTILLRNERDGRSDGRVYTVTYRAFDASGNQTTAEAIVVVPHSPL
jgi:hypothetical protein